MPWNPYSELRFVPLFAPVVDSVGVNCARLYGLLATFCRHDGGWSGQCSPSLERLADQMGLDRRRLRRLLKELEASPWLEVDRSPNAMGRPSVYTLADPGAQPTPHQGVKSAPSPGVETAPTHGADLAPSPGVKSPPLVELSVDKVVEKGKNKARERAGPQGQINHRVKSTPGSNAPQGQDDLALFARSWHDLTERSDFDDFVNGCGQLSSTHREVLVDFRKACGGSDVEFRARVSARLSDDNKDFLRTASLLHWTRGPILAPAGPAKPTKPYDVRTDGPRKGLGAYKMLNRLPK